MLGSRFVKCDARVHETRPGPMGASAVQPMIDAWKSLTQVLFVSLHYFLVRYFTNLASLENPTAVNSTMDTQEMTA